MWTHQQISLRLLTLGLVLLVHCARLSSCGNQAPASRSRQLSNIEPYLRDRARQSANQESLTLGGSGAISSESRSRQLVGGRSYSYVGVKNYPTDQKLVSSTYHSHQYNVNNNDNNYPAYRPANQESYAPLQSYNVGYQGPSYGKPYRLANGGDIYEPHNRLQVGNYEPQRFVPAGAQMANPAALTTTTPEPVLGQLFRERLPELREVLELADPTVRVFSSKAATKKGQSNAIRTIVSFRLARKLIAPLENIKVLQPEIYIQDEAVSYPSGVLSTTSSTTAEPVSNEHASAPLLSKEQGSGWTKSAENKTKRPQVDALAESQDESQEEPHEQQEESDETEGQQQQPAEERNDEIRDQLAKNLLETDAEVENLARENDEVKLNNNGISIEDEVEHEEDKRASESLEVKLDDLEQLDRAVAKKRPVEESRDKIINDFGKDKLDKVGNFLSSSEANALKFTKKIGLEHNSPDEVEDKRLEPASSETIHKQKILGDEQQVLAALLSTTEGQGSKPVGGQVEVDDREINEDDQAATVTRSLRSLSTAQDWPHRRRIGRSRLEVTGTRGYVAGLARL